MLQDLSFGRLENEFYNKLPKPGILWSVFGMEIS